jgi:DNA repair exonuclease SbcCD ATPase subunit
MTIDLNQLRQDALSVLATEKASTNTGREAIDASKKRRAEISTLLNTMHEEYRQISEQLHALPDRKAYALFASFRCRSCDSLPGTAQGHVARNHQHAVNSCRG